MNNVQKNQRYLVPDWPCSKTVKSVVTTRLGGYSHLAYAGFNLADHVGDSPEAVQRNRQQLKADLGLGSEPLWLQQEHGTRVVDVAGAETGSRADGSYALGATGVCAVLTADCLPVLLANTAGTRVAALHAGWRGLAAGIIEQGVDRIQDAGDELIAYLGPAIGPEAFEVGEDVVDAFCRHDSAAEAAFRPAGVGKWLANIYQLARLRLAARGVMQSYGGSRCTFTESEQFFSYRRDRTCGRMASLIWIEDAG